MKYKLQDQKLWRSPDRREWVQCAYSAADETGAAQEISSVAVRLSSGVLNALGQVVYYQQGYTQDGAHFIIDVDGSVVQHASPDTAVKGQQQSDTVVIELINPGPLHQDAQQAWRTWWGDKLDHDQWIRTDGAGGWLCAQGDQLHSLIELVRCIKQTYTVTIEADTGLSVDPHVWKILDG